MTPPAPRADAVRNREKLVAAAGARFADDGPDAPLEAIARDAGVGIGTLYRHFPKRADLVGAVYAEELDQLADVPALLDGRTGAEALEAWMARLAEYAQAKAALVPAIRAAGGPMPVARETLVGALAMLLDAGRADGTLGAELDAEDVLHALAGVFTAADPARVARLTRFVLDGLRTGPRGSADG